MIEMLSEQMETYPVSMPMLWASKDSTQSNIQAYPSYAQLNSFKTTWKTSKVSVTAKTLGVLLSVYLHHSEKNKKNRPVCR